MPLESQVLTSDGQALMIWTEQSQLRNAALLLVRHLHTTLRSISRERIGTTLISGGSTQMGANFLSLFCLTLMYNVYQLACTLNRP